MRYITLLILLFCISSHLMCEEVGKFSYLGKTGDFQNGRINVPHGIVAMSEYVHIGTPSDIIKTGNPCSIIFVVDVSQSNGETDPQGVRFQVLKDVLDTIYNRNPEVMVGMVYLSSELYFNPADDERFQKIGGNEYKGGYLPLMTLNQEYSGTFTTTNGNGDATGKTPYTKSGIDILKMYAETKSGTFGTMVPTYHPTYEILQGVWKPDFPGAGALTNITSAFAGAKDALTHSPHSDDKKFIIFLSDGNATVPEYDVVKRDEYVAGVEVPTTFTIFYNPDEGNLQKLETMTANIKSNGFSSSNAELTNMWDMAMDHDNLLHLIVDKIISKIITSSTTFTTTDVEVNGLGPITGWDDSGFYFSAHFPLIDEVTPFHYEIEYHVKTDSIDGGDTISVKEYDTTVVYDFEVATVDNPDDSILKMEWWGRGIRFRQNGAEVSVLSNESSDFELLFHSYRVDTFYSYTDVALELKSKGTSDSEMLTLSGGGQQMMESIAHLIGGTSTAGNGVLEHTNPDTIVAVFRNPHLPLDTLQVSIPYFEGTYYSVEAAVYYDTDADGFVDSLLLRTNDTLTDAVAELLLDSVLLPPERQFEINSFAVSGKEVSVQLNSGGTIVTSVEGYDKIRLVDTLYPESDVYICPFEVTPVDSVAPVILNAILKDSIKSESEDWLLVRFSEPVTQTEAERTLEIKEGISNTLYQPDIEKVEGEKEQWNFLLKEDSNIKSGDSLHINAIAFPTIADADTVEQKNGNNRFVPLVVEVLSDFVTLKEAVYYDDSKDGWIDKITLSLSQNVAVEYLQDVVQSLSFPEERELSIISSSYGDGLITLMVTQSQSGYYSTAVNKEQVTMNDTVKISENHMLIPSEVSVLDSMAPVVVSAVYQKWQKRRDTLVVTHSEPVSIVNENSLPYMTIGSNSSSYEMHLRTGAIDGTVITYPVEDEDVAKEGDSLWFAVSSGIVDENKLTQTENNIHRPIAFLSYYEPEVLSAAYMDSSNPADGYIDYISLHWDSVFEEKLLPKVSSFVLLSSRTISIDSLKHHDNNTILYTTEGRDDYPVTEVEGEVIELKEQEDIESNETWLFAKQSIALEDSLAPVPVRAQFFPTKETEGEIIDTLLVTYSENISGHDGGVVYTFYDKSAEEIVSPEIVLDNAKEGNACRYEVPSLEHYLPEPGLRDSLAFSAVVEVSDTVGIKQELTSVRIPLEVNDYTYGFRFSLYPNPYRFEKGYQNPVIVEYGNDTLPEDAVALIVTPKGNRVYTDPIEIRCELYDAVGNIISKDANGHKAFDKESGTSVLALPMINHNGKPLASGAYSVQISIVFPGGKVGIYTIMLGVKE